MRQGSNRFTRPPVFVGRDAAASARARHTLLAPVCLAVAGLTGTLVLLGAAVIGYAVLVVARPRLTLRPVTVEAGSR